MDGSHVVTATFTLKHGENLTISGIPYGTEYTVEETGRGGYNLQGVYQGDTILTGDTGLLTDADGHPLGASGSITADSAGVALEFHNAPAPVLPFAGGPGKWFFVGCGVLLMLVALVWRIALLKKGSRR